MGIYINDNKLVLIMEPNFISIDSPVKIDKYLENKIKFVVSRYESLVGYPIKNEIRQLLCKYGHWT